MPDPEIRVVAIDQYTDFPDGKERVRMRVQWRYGDHGPFLSYFPKENFNAATARMQLEAEARELANLTK